MRKASLTSVSITALTTTKCEKKHFPHTQKLATQQKPCAAAGKPPLGKPLGKIDVFDSQARFYIAVRAVGARFNLIRSFRAQMGDGADRNGSVFCRWSRSAVVEGPWFFLVFVSVLLTRLVALAGKVIRSRALFVA